METRKYTWHVYSKLLNENIKMKRAYLWHKISAPKASIGKQKL